MTVTREDAVALTGTRVRVSFGAETSCQLLRAVTPNDVVILAGHTGMETLIPLDEVKSIEDARIECAVCHDRVNKVHGDVGRCAECERAYAATRPVPREYCEQCERPGAVYFPGLKTWMCPECRQKQRGMDYSRLEGRALAVANAVCRSADKDSTLHVWKQFKSQWVCRACETKVFGRPANA